MKKLIFALLLAVAVLTLTACQTRPAIVPAATETPAASAASTVNETPAAAETPAAVEPSAAPAVTDAPAETKAPVAEYRKMTAAEAKARMDSGDPVIILDVRTQSEFATGHIAGALLLPNENIGTERPAELPDTDAEILVYCRSGNRSAQAARKLVAMGYTNVWDFGGIINWPYSTVTD